MTMSGAAYTTLKVIDEGVVLYDWHAQRMSAAGPEVRAAFEAFARTAAAGVYSLRGVEGRLEVTRREGSRMFEGIPTRVCVSPLIGSVGRQPKAAPPSAYDGVRMPGVCTLLTSADGSELYEACVASLVAWDGARFVCVPSDRPRIESTAEAALRAHLPVLERPLYLDDELPLLLLNAVGTWQPSIAGRSPFPAEQRKRIDLLLVQTAHRGR